MGGGDLNAKKAWHPNTIKNQERVWKAEQAAAEEKKRIVELERERQLERDRASLNKLAKSNVGPSGVGNDDRLHWMYEKPDKKVQHEEYLLGKAIDKNHDPVGKSEMDEIPAISRRVVGSSMSTISGDTQVDLARKMREDPLLLVKERERAARAALLNNPVQRARLAVLLRKEQESKKEGKQKKSKKKSKDLDNRLAEKLQTLSGDKGIDLASLLASDDSNSDCSDTKAKKKKKKKKSKKKTKRKKDSSSDSDSEPEGKEKTKVVRKKESKKQKGDRKRKATTESEDESCSKRKKSSKSETKRKVHSNYDSSEHQSSDEQIRDKHTSKAGDHRSLRNDGGTRERQVKDEKYFKSDRQKKDYRYARDERSLKVDRLAKSDRKIRDNKRNNSEERPRDDGSRENYKNDRKKDHNYKKVSSNKKEGRVEKHSGLSEEEKAAKLAEMAAAGIEREKQRERRVAQQLREKDKAEQASTALPRSRNVINQLPDSLESRIHSNRHYIQRDQKHMNEHFARR